MHFLYLHILQLISVESLVIIQVLLLSAVCHKLILADPYYLERSGLYIGQGKAMMSRSGIFRASEGVAIEMNNRVYKLPSFNGIF